MQKRQQFKIFLCCFLIQCRKENTALQNIGSIWNIDWWLIFSYKEKSTLLSCATIFVNRIKMRRKKIWNSSHVNSDLSRANWKICTKIIATRYFARFITHCESQNKKSEKMTWLQGVSHWNVQSKLALIDKVRSF